MARVTHKQAETARYMFGAKGKRAIGARVLVTHRDADMRGKNLHIAFLTRGYDNWHGKFSHITLREEHIVYPSGGHKFLTVREVLTMDSRQRSVDNFPEFA